MAERISLVIFATSSSPNDLDYNIAPKSSPPDMTLQDSLLKNLLFDKVNILRVLKSLKKLNNIRMIKLLLDFDIGNETPFRVFILKHSFGINFHSSLKLSGLVNTKADFR